MKCLIYFSFSEKKIAPNASKQTENSKSDYISSELIETEIDYLYKYSDLISSKTSRISIINYNPNFV